MISQQFSDWVLQWYELHGRKSLPWQQNPTLYRVWVSEIMLQQTQVSTVIPYYQRFLQRFPTISSLANASEDEVLAHWAGLGYYARARNLQKAAKQVQTQFSGSFPVEYDSVLSLSGVGRSTAGAILSLALNQPHAILDGNVKRILARHQAIAGHYSVKSVENQLWEAATTRTPRQNNKQYTQAMMDLGSMICTRTKPKCTQCPVQNSCQAYQQQRISEFPTKKTRNTLPEKSTTMLIINDGERLILEKRPSKGIWGGLWSLPEIENNEQIISTLQSLAINSFQQKALTQFTHTFTHYRLHISPLIIDVDNLKTGIEIRELKALGLPTPVKKILSNIFPG